MSKLKLFTLIILVVIGQNVMSQEYSSKQIDSIVQKSMSVAPTAGVAVVVVKDNQIVHMKGYGITSANTKEKVDENTRFAIASNSKAFTSAALAILVDEGQLSWTDQVIKFIPEFKMYDPYVTENFTIQDLLTHRSGLGLGAGDLMFFPDGSDFTIEDILQSFQYQKPVSAFRTKYDYDNLLYIVAGEVVKRISGVSWATFVESRIMKPLGMNHSAGIRGRLEDTSNIASPHAVKNNQLHELNPLIENGETIGAAGGIYANVKDLSHWLLMHLNEGKYGDHLNQELISKKNLDEIWKAHTNINFNAKPKAPYKTHFKAYGLGWILNDKNGYVVAEHTGGFPGMLSRTIMIPELNVGIVVLTNTAPGGYSFWTIAQAISDAYLNVKKTDWIDFASKNLIKKEAQSDSTTTAVWKKVNKAKSKHIQYSDFIGTYKDNWFGNIEIWEKDGQLWMKSIRSPKLTGQMFFYQANTFAVKWNFQDMPCDAFAMFTLDENGKTIGFKMKGISPSIDFSFDFQDLDLKRINNPNLNK